MMSELINVADQVRAGAKRLEWVLQLADALERVGSLEQAEKEAKKATEKAKKDLEKAKSDLAKAADKLRDAEESVPKAVSQANAVLAGAHEEAKALANQAKADAAAIINAAQGKAQATVDAAISQAAGIAEQIKAEKSVLAQYQGETVKAIKDLAKIHEDIEEAKAEAAKLFARFK